MEILLNSIWFVLMKGATMLQDDAHNHEREQRRELEMRQKKFMQIVGENQRMIWHVARMYCKSEEDQKELFQDILHQLWVAFPKYRGEATPGTWIYKVALYTALTKRAAKKPVIDTYGEIPERIHPLSHPDQHDETNLMEILDTVAPTDKAILLLLAEGFELREIGAITGLKENTLAQRVRRVRNKIKEIVNLNNKQR